MFSKVKSIRGYTLGQVFCDIINFTKFYPTKSKSKAYETLNEFIAKVGVPNHINTDGDKGLTEGDWCKMVKSHGITQSTTEPHSPWKNYAESGIRELKRIVKRVMKKKKVPLWLWYFETEYAGEIWCIMTTRLHQLHG
eukprot:13594148-Ditylum_brightwellii.AAC.1